MKAVLQSYGRKFSISFAARVLRIGRPALSNVLNGKAALSIPLATRIEEYFKYDREALLNMQFEYDLYIHDTKENLRRKKI